MSLTPLWTSWCRLCSKVGSEVNILSNNVDYSSKETKMTLKEALEKYFWVQSSSEDIYPNVLCADCFILVSSLINFNERVERVQQMYNFLVETPGYDLRSVRLKFDVSDDDGMQWWFPNNTIHDEIATKDGETGRNRQVTQQCETELIRIKQEKLSADVRQVEKEKYVDEDGSGKGCVDQEEMIYDEQTANDSHEKEEDPPLDPFDEQKQSEPSSESDTNEADGEFERSLYHNTDQDCLSPLTSGRNDKRKRRKCKLKDRNYKKKYSNPDFPLNAACKECGENFRLYSTLCDHMKLKHGKNNENKHMTCPSCDRVLVSWYNFERHMRIHIPVEERKTKKCLECEARFTSKAQLEAHINYKHKKEKPFVCEECGLCLRTNSNLRQHMLIHTDVKPFACEVCKKKFKNNSRLKIHMDTHSPNKHICAICGLQLNSRATLNRHFLVHSDDMTHKCDYCGRAFKRAKALKNHLLLHTGLKPYSCEFCDRTFANGSNCRSHMKKLHPEELANLEASGNKTHAKNIPKLETLKAVTKAADNLTPVVTKFSGCFAFGKKPKNISDKSKTYPPKSKFKKNNALKSTTPSDPQQTLPLDGNNSPARGSTTPNNIQCIMASSPTSIPNFDNIYQHLIMKHSPSELQIKRPPSSLSQSSAANNPSLTPQHNSFYNELPQSKSMDNALSAQQNEDLVRSPEESSQHSPMTPSCVHDDHSNGSSTQTYYGVMRPTIPHGTFM